MVKDYRPELFGKKEEDLVKTFKLQMEDAKQYFTACIKPRLDRAYKLYIAYSGDRQEELKKFGKRWQANVFVPYIHAVVETLKPRILDARPEFGIQGRTQDDQKKASKLQQLADFTWEKAGMDNTSELLVDAALVYGTGFLQVSWKKDERKHKFLTSKDITSKKLQYKEKKQIFYDDPFAEWVDNYDLWYDWHNIDAKSKQYWFRRKTLTGAEIKRRYPMADKQRLEMALHRPGGDLTDYGSIRNIVKLTHQDISKNDEFKQIISGLEERNYDSTEDPDLKMYEVFEWWRPFVDLYTVLVNDVPILKGGSIPNPYDFKEAPFIGVPYLQLPNEFEGYGIPMILESPQIMLNMIKNQRLDAMTLNIHKMWVVNPLANINKEELVTRPFGIIYSTDPNGVREIQFSDIKASAYKEEELLKGDMRYSSGVDDFSMGVSGGASSATEVRHLRESTLERVRLFINHMGDAYADLLRYWISMYRQFFTQDIIIRITGEDGQIEFPLIEKDDLNGMFDYKATVLPSIAGQQDVEKKQGMDLFQLLINLPFVDPQKLTAKILFPWKWNLESITKQEETMLPPGMEGMPPGMEGTPEFGKLPLGGGVPAGVGDAVAKMLGAGEAGGPSPMTELGGPVNLLKAGAPPTPKGAPTTNPRGLNRGGKVNTNIPIKPTYNPQAQLMNRATNIQK